MLVGLVKTVIFIFPFIKELFLGKGPPHAQNQPESPMVHLLKRVIIGIGCISVAANAYLGNRLYNLATQYLAISREVTHLRELDKKRKEVKTSPQSPAIATQPVKKQDRPPADKPPLHPTLPVSRISTSPQMQRELVQLRRINSIDE